MDINSTHVGVIHTRHAHCQQGFLPGDAHNGGVCGVKGALADESILRVGHLRRALRGFRDSRPGKPLSLMKDTHLGTY